MLRLCESKGLTDALKLNYDGRNPFVICAGTLQPIYKAPLPFHECMRLRPFLLSLPL